MATEESLLSLAQSILRDNGVPFSAEVTGNGEIARYNLPAQNIDPDGLQVWRDTGAGPVALQPGTTGDTYTLEADDGIITLNAGPLAAGGTLLVTGRSYIYQPGGMASFIDIAFDLHAKGTNPPLALADLTLTQEYLIALYAVVESLWAEVAAAAQEVDVNTPEGMHIPAGQRFQQLMALLERLQAHYQELAGALNFGPFAIQIFTLRRISRTTNRLVPVYRAQEFDDHSLPTRVYPPIPSGEL